MWLWSWQKSWFSETLPSQWWWASYRKIQSESRTSDLSHCFALIPPPPARWMLIIISQHSAAFLFNFDSLMFFIIKHHRGFTEKRRTQHAVYIKFVFSMLKSKYMQHLQPLQKSWVFGFMHSIIWISFSKYSNSIPAAKWVWWVTLQFFQTFSKT